MNISSYEIPVLFIAFNRPQITEIVFNNIKKIKPNKLYLACDGPRKNIHEDKMNVKLTRDILDSVDWPCTVKKLYRDNNLGCKLAVSEAIDWFFENENSGIILEDDCLSEEGWFLFAEEMLKKYENDERVMSISANFFHGKKIKPKESYIFTVYTHSWGWATWKRAWKFNDRNMSSWPLLRKTSFLHTVGNGSYLFKLFWDWIFQRSYNNDGDFNTWDYGWTFCCMSQNGLTVIPTKNLVKNIGFGEDGTHTTQTDKYIMDLDIEKIEFPLNHPNNVVSNYDYDILTLKKCHHATYINQLKKRIYYYLKHMKL